ncbi:hypothetical protein [Mesorhizobium ciceri]|uniref:hypothetical protein n=1 Tax=Mesorhizobium TaxID=68287 RepID=UPI0004B5D456|nr:hypothetical protein [Mesorhizobium ciceri]
MTKALVSFPAFPIQPDDVFVSTWLGHINETGYPETFPNVSTTHPPKDGKVVLLSGEIKVPILRREGQEWVPCPICSPTSPQFKVGRMAYFPEELAVRFIGHNCASKHFGELYAEAEERFKVEARCRQLVAVWAGLVDRRELLLHFIESAMPVAAALHFVREQIDTQAPGFSGFLYVDLAKRQGDLIVRRDTGLRDQKGQLIIDDIVLGRVDGYLFLKKTFAPQNVLREAKSFISSMEVPLPNWEPGSDDEDAAIEILARGGQALKMMSSLRDVASTIATAQSFLRTYNLNLLDRWFQEGASPFQSLVIKREGNQLLLRAESFEGSHFANALFPEATLASIETPIGVFDPLTSEMI